MDGGQLGDFSLVEKIGEGGMGRVFKARDSRLDRFVAIKMLTDDRVADADRRARFIQEAKAASALNHPNIITIYEIGEQDRQTFIAMELLDGKPLSETIPRKGLRVAEALRLAVQIADALTAAHAAGIVHRDLKPANIMVDAHGRVKVLDFGLAKLSVPTTIGAEEATQTIAEVRPVTEDGIIIGSIPYMSPEQAEGKPVDARSDIFSFGAVLYEMITGQRAFQGASRISTLAAVVEKDPQPPSQISAGTPPELERLIARCLRKDVNRRSQNMSDVKLTLEELRDESESGKLAGPAAADRSGTRRWLWPTVTVASAVVAAGSLAWIFGNPNRIPSKGPDLVRLSPEDGHSYKAPALSPDGGFVAYISDRSGKDELWLQQVGGGEPIQLTHSSERVDDPSFFPDGKHILYLSISPDKKSTIETIETIATLGGAPKVLIRAGQMGDYDPKLSPDGRQIAYVENRYGWHLMAVSSAGGQPRELQTFIGTPGILPHESTWTSDSRYLLFGVTKPTQAGSSEWDWLAFPADGGDPVKTGIGEKMRAAGAGQVAPLVATGDRILGAAVKNGHTNVWEVSLSPGSWAVQGLPRQLTFGTLHEFPWSASASGMVALNIESYEAGIYLIPLSLAAGQPMGVAQKLDQDVRPKQLYFPGGVPGSAYYYVEGSAPEKIDHYALDLNSKTPTLVSVGLSQFANFAVSPDGRRIAYSYPDGDAISISVGETGAGYAQARVLCKGCGRVQWFSPDGRFLFYIPEVKVKPDLKRKVSVHLLDVSTGKDRPWAEDPTRSVSVRETIGNGFEWVWLTLRQPGEQASEDYLVRWREGPIPLSELTKTKVPQVPGQHRFSPTGDFYYVDGDKFMLRRFNPQTGDFGEAHDLVFLPGSAVALKTSDRFAVRSRGLVFAHSEPGGSSLWLMKLPR
jgi:eukaryotic-like serine/threonine-protein kinase